MPSVSTFRCLALLGIIFVAGCDDDDDSSPPDIPHAFAEVDDTLRAAYFENDVPMGLTVYAPDGAKLFQQMYGNFSPDRRVAIASASKLVSGVTLFRLMDAGYLSLDSTTAEVLGWAGDHGAITLRHLLSFTSGLTPEHSCTYQSSMTLAECVDEIEQRDLLALPGARFDYGSTHLHVAARMAEVVVGASWNEIYEEQIRAPLQLAPEFAYYAGPRQGIGLQPINPLPAGGMRASMNDYASLLHFVYHKGQWQGSQLLAPGIFDLQAVQPYPDAVMGNTPSAVNARYGLTAWLECATPATGCATLSSPGAFGFTPWLDRETGYYAILGMELEDFRSDRGLGPRIQQTLKPLIVDAIERL